MTSHAKTFLTGSRFRTDSRSSAVGTDWDAVRTALAVRSKKFLAVWTALAVRSKKILAVQTALAVRSKKLLAVRTALAVRSKKKIALSNGSCRAFKKMLAVQTALAVRPKNSPFGQLTCKDSSISRNFLLKFWAKKRRCSLYTRPLS